jgi:hypothetical protein
MDLRHTIQTSICQRHRSVTVPPHQRTQLTPFVLYSQPDGNHTALEQFEQPVNITPCTRKKKSRFGKHRLARQQRRFQYFPLPDCPFVILLRREDIPYECSSVEQCASHSPNPSKCFGFVAKSAGTPST